MKYCERETLFWMKKEAEQAGFKGTRMGPKVLHIVLQLASPKTTLVISCSPITIMKKPKTCTGSQSSVADGDEQGRVSKFYEQ